MEALIVDVREPQEFDAEHAPGAVNLPLSELDARRAAWLAAVERPIVLMCRSGKRAAVAAQVLQQAQSSAPWSIYDGGILAWKQRGLPVVSDSAQAAPMPIMRQVQLIAGVLIVTSLLLAWLLDERWAAGALLVGVGLTLAGATGFCGLALLLARLPWNRRPAPQPVAAPAEGSCRGCDTPQNCR